MGDAFAPWHIIILLVVLVVLFGAKRLPGAAHSLGESMHIFKKSVQGLHPDESDSAANPSMSVLPPTAFPPPAVPAPDATAQQLQDLQRQVQDLQRQSAGSNGQPAETQSPPSF